MKRIRRPARASRECSVDDCKRPSRSRFSPFCDKHYKRWLTHGDPLINKTPRPTIYADDSYRLTVPEQTWMARPEQLGWKGDGVGINGAHARVIRLRGRACEQQCSHCDRSAKDWAYDHLDPNQKISKRDGPYSPDPAHYFPLCKSCHTRFDSSRGRPDTCVRGHRWNEESIYIDPKGRRSCRICRRENEKKWRLGHVTHLWNS